MFTLIFLVLIGIGAFFLLKGIGERNRSRIISGAVIIALTAALFWYMDFWGEKLWFDALGYNERFWTLFTFQLGFVIGGALLGMIIIMLLLISVPKHRKWLRYGALGLGVFIGGGWGLANWSVFLRFWFKEATDVKDPIMGQDTGFYLFELPFFEKVYGVLLTLSIISLIVAFFSRFRIQADGQNLRLQRADDLERTKFNRALFMNAGVLLIILAAGKFLERYELLYSDLGAVMGPGWTDVNIMLPALHIIITITLIMAFMVLVPAGRKLLMRPFRKSSPGRSLPIYSVGLAGVITFGSWIIGLGLIPMAFQQFRVEPNEISYEKPYIENNIDFTRQGFNLHIIEDKEFPADETFTREMVQKNQSIFDNIRLWDWRALDAVLKQFQEIRLYYEFADVDIDRYHFGGEYRQVMVSAREMMASNLPDQSQTFVNKVFKYTHGYGMALTTVSDFTEEGLPNFLVKNIPPESKHPELEVKQPRIYYGELTKDYVIANSSEQEFDYPKGDQNEYNRYDGKGGIQLSNFFRQLIFSYKLDELKLLLSSYPTDESRLLYRREVKQRVKSLAPFLVMDEDPYIVNANGELYWMMDAYTTSSHYPYSEPFSGREQISYKEGQTQRNLQIRHNPGLDGINYIRNSVKVVVNAYDGSVDFYIFDENDPVIQVWNKIFPGLMKKREDMPEELLKHIRYPHDYLLVQGLVYAKYHMGDPEVFYNQEDLWIRATENYYGEVNPVDPYYIMWQQPDSEEAEFSLILPFTPKNRQVSIGWIAGLCDPPNYGRFLAYSFPKEKRILGPQQVETKIDQNSYLSGQLSLWDQRGSRVIRGNVLAIPIEKTIIYVEPIYLQAETAAYPELRLVCVMHNDNLSYAETFDEALAGIFGDDVSLAETPGTPEKETRDKQRDPDATMIQKANEAFERYLNATGRGDFKKASDALEQLRQSLQQLADEEGNTKLGDTIK